MEPTDASKFKNKTSNAIRVLAFFNAAPGKGNQLEKILRELVEPTRNEPGNIAYILHRSTKNPDEFLFDELFVSTQAFEEHAQQSYIKALPSRIIGLTEGPIRIETYFEI